MMENIISPFNEGKPFRFGERLVDLKKINKILVFESDRPISEIVLPNGEDPNEVDMAFLIHSFWEGKVTGLRECTAGYILLSKSEKSNT